jgi:hypothetical protein
MHFWRLLPKGKHRSTNWRRSIYGGNLGAVIVRAQSAFEARSVAAKESEQEGASSGDLLTSPWKHENDTTIEPWVDLLGGGDLVEGNVRCGDFKDRQLPTKLWVVSEVGVLCAGVATRG